MNFQEIETHPLFSQVSKVSIEVFKKYHLENPQIWDLFKKYAAEAKQAGKLKYSSNAIIERIRWELDINTRGSCFKINARCSSLYPRALMILHPEYAGFFSLRSREDDDAREVLQQSFDFEASGYEN